ncbi:DUF1674 domain-containing protein [uncultured Litoreibacter sp.]
MGRLAKADLQRPSELRGREPARYGDWELMGIAIDF